MLQNIQNKSILRSFLSYAIPCIIGMFLTSFITIVDGIFISMKIGESGLAAVNLTLPVLYILLGITIMVAIGGVTLALHSMGRKEHVQAGKYFTTTVIVNAIVNIVAVVILGLFLDNIIGMLNTEQILNSLMKDYMGTMKYFYLFMMMNITFSIFIRSEGKPQMSMFFGLAGNIINIILDYIFIIRLDYGMRGAAWATGISVMIPFACGLLYFAKGKSAFKFHKTSLDIQVLKKILFNGSSEFISQISIAITTYFFNIVLLRRIGVSGVAAFTIVGYISFIQYMILMGIAQGVHPLVGYSFGAKDKEYILRLLSIAVKAVIIVGVGAFLITFAATDLIASLFSKENEDLLDIASIGLRLFSISFLINGYNVVASAYFTALGDAKISGIISILRSLVLVVILILLLPYLIGDIGIWITAPLAEALTFFVSFSYLKRSKKNISTWDAKVDHGSFSPAN